MPLPYEDRTQQQPVHIERHRTGWAPGVAFVFNPDGGLVTQFDTGSSKRFQRLYYPPGILFTVRVMTYDGPDLYDQTYRFEALDDPDVVEVCWTGPGLSTILTKKGRGRTVGYEYGVIVAGARRLG